MNGAPQTPAFRAITLERRVGHCPQRVATFGNAPHFDAVRTPEVNELARLNRRMDLQAPAVWAAFVTHRQRGGSKL